MNLILIKLALDKELCHSVINENNMKFNNIINEFKNNKNLAEFYSIVTTLLNAQNLNQKEAEFFINECYKNMQQLDLNSLISLYNKNVDNLNESYKDNFNQYKQKVNDFLFMSRESKNLKYLSKCYNSILEHITQEKIDVNKFEEQFKNLNENDLTFIKEYYLSNHTDFYNSLIESTIEHIDNMMTNATDDKDLLLSLYQTKDKISKMDEQDLTTIVKLKQLKEQLEQNK